MVCPQQTVSTSDFPKIALLVPCYNGSEHLPKLWQSVEAQTQPFAECWVYDDASTDDTSSVAASLGAQVLRGETNHGPSRGRNALLRATQCEWVHFHDADDRMSATFVESMGACAQQSNAEVILCQVDWEDAKSGETVLEWRYQESVYATPAAPTDMLVNIIGGIGGLYQRSMLEQIGGFDVTLRFWEDLDLHYRLWREGANFRVVDEVLVTALRHQNSSSNASLNEVWRAKSELLQRYLDDPVSSSEFAAGIGREAQNIAFRQLEAGDREGARSSLRLAQSAGVAVPNTNNSLLRLIGRSLGPWTAFQLQQKIRRVFSK